MPRPVGGPKTGSTLDVTDSRGIAAGWERPRVSVVLYHAGGTETVELGEGCSVVVGRSHRADVRIDDPSLSGLHARFSFADGTVSVTDLASTNGTRLAGESIRSAPLRSGDEIALGNLSASVHILHSRHAVRHGVEGFDRALRRLEEEVARSQEFGRKFGLLLLRTRSAKQAIGALCPALTKRLRRIDHIGLYDATSALVLLPEASLLDARALGEQLAKGSPELPALYCSVGVFPDAGASAQALLGRLRHASRAASDAQPVVVALGDREPEAAEPGELIVLDPAMQELYRVVAQVAARPLPVLIMGETGAGKEVVITQLHRHSGRTGPLKVVNCATLPRDLTESALFGHERGAFTGAERRHRGLVEEADGGTLFLDEVGELGAGAQAALLRVLQEKKVMRVGSTREIDVDVRVVAATHRDLERMVADGVFREDLLYRLNSVTLEVPPLRRRPAEVMPLAEHFLRQTSRDWGVTACRFSDHAAQALAHFDWPGNIRQLRNVVERAAALCTGTTIDLADLPEGLQGPMQQAMTAAPPVGPAALVEDDARSFRERVRAFEIAVLTGALQRSNGNVAEAARALSMPVRSLGSRLKALGLR